MLEVKTRRFIIKLCALTETLEFEKDLGELKKCTVMYAVNGIPRAIIEPAHGFKVNPEALSILDTDIEAAVKDRKPVGIIVKIATEKDATHHRSSKDNETDTDTYWPYEKECFIFKGYLIKSQTTRTANKMVTQLILTHWLSDLARITMYAPNVFGENSAQFARDYYQLKVQTASASDNNRVWWPIVYDNQVSSMDKLVDYYRAIANKLMDDQISLKDEKAFHFDDKLVERCKRALDRLELGNKVVFHPSIRDAISKVDKIISETIGSRLYSYWKDTTFWNMFVNDGLTMFLAAVAPGVDKAFVIPFPGSISRDEKDHFELTNKDMFEIIPTTVSRPTLSCVIGVHDKVSGLTDNAATGAYNGWIFPNPPGDPPLTGPAKTVRLPDWLLTLYGNCLNNLRFKTTLVNAEDLQTPDDTSLQSEVETIKKAQETIAHAYIQHAFLVEAFAGVSLIVVTPFRGDIMPGAQMHIKYTGSAINGKERGIELYGTVETVQLMAADGQFCSEFVLSNIRNVKEYNDNRLNPPTRLFEEPWDATDETLYVIKD